MTTEVATSLSELKEGDLIRFRYKRQSGNNRWYKWEAVGVYLGYDGLEIAISFRPKAGTTNFIRSHFTGIVRLATIQERQAQGQHREDSRVKLPYRFPGAVDSP